jgi:ABC-type sugar transport system permease subunit
MTPLMYIYRVGIGSAGGARIGDASAMSFLLSFVTLMIVMIQFAIVRRRERD